MGFELTELGYNERKGLYLGTQFLVQLVHGVIVKFADACRVEAFCLALLRFALQVALLFMAHLAEHDVQLRVRNLGQVGVSLQAKSQLASARRE